MISLDQYDITKICEEVALRFQLPGAACGRMRVLVLGRNLRSLADGGEPQPLVRCPSVYPASARGSLGDSLSPHRTLLRCEQPSRGRGVLGRVAGLGDGSRLTRPPCSFAER